jgi:hypothetical protein
MMQLRTLFFMIFASFSLSIVAIDAAPAPQRKVATAKDARNYLQKKYPALSSKASTERFYYEGAKINEVDSPVLAKRLPRTRFFVTKLDTTYMSYRQVETLVSVSISDGKTTVQETFSPIFTTVSPEFRNQFRNLRARSEIERKEIGEAIASLFQQITYKGGLRKGDFQQQSSHIELLTDKRHWRTIYFEFDEDGRLTSIPFENPSSKEKD